jgi:hypothetical protein
MYDNLNMIYVEIPKLKKDQLKYIGIFFISTNYAI